MHDQIDRETRSIAIAGAAHAKAVAFALDGRDGSFCIEPDAQLARLPHQPADEILIEGRQESRALLEDDDLGAGAPHAVRELDGDVAAADPHDSPWQRTQVDTIDRKIVV